MTKTEVDHTKPDFNNFGIIVKPSDVTLQLGSGKSQFGTYRIDLYETENTTHVLNIDYDKLPFEDESIDFIYCKSILEHLKNLANFERECYRVLKKGGRLFVRTDYAGYILWHIGGKSHEHNQVLLPYYEKHGFGHEQKEDAHYHLFVKSHLEKLFKRFKNHQFSYSCGGRNKYWHWILTKLPFHLGASEIAMLCEKPGKKPNQDKHENCSGSDCKVCQEWEDYQVYRSSRYEL